MSAPALDFLASVLASGDPDQWVRRADAPEMLGALGAGEAAAFLVGYLAETGALPPRSILEKESGLKLPPAPEGEPAYHYERLRESYVERGLKLAVDEASKLLSLPQKDVDGALAEIRGAVVRLSATRGARAVLDFRESYDRVYVDYQLAMKGLHHTGIPYPYPTLQENSAGAAPGDLVSVVGRTGRGKTYMMLYMAAAMWRATGLPVAFFTEEMPAVAIEQRLAVMAAGVPLKPLRTGRPVEKVEFGGVSQEEYEAALEEALSGASEEEAPFHIIDGRMASTVDDVYLLCSTLRPALVFVDGAYLLRHPDRRMGRFERVAENCDALKIASIMLDVPIVASWQLSREAERKMKKKNAELPGLEDIGDSDMIGRHSSVVLGLLQHDDVDTLQYREVYIMKGRYGEAGRFAVRWDFSRMDFSEVGDDEAEGGALEYV